MVKLFSSFENIYLVLCKKCCDVADVVDSSRSRGGKSDWEFIYALIELQFAAVFIGLEVQEDEADIVWDLSHDKVTIFIVI